jgi:hypothetical protein
MAAMIAFMVSLDTSGHEPEKVIVTVKVVVEVPVVACELVELEPEVEEASVVPEVEEASVVPEVEASVVPEVEEASVVGAEVGPSVGGTKSGKIASKLGTLVIMPHPSWAKPSTSFNAWVCFPYVDWRYW